MVARIPGLQLWPPCWKIPRGPWRLRGAQPVPADLGTIYNHYIIYIWFNKYLQSTAFRVLSSRSVIETGESKRDWTKHFSKAQQCGIVPFSQVICRLCSRDFHIRKAESVWTDAEEVKEARDAKTESKSSKKTKAWRCWEKQTKKHDVYLNVYVYVYVYVYICIRLCM